MTVESPSALLLQLIRIAFSLLRRLWRLGIGIRIYYVLLLMAIYRWVGSHLRNWTEHNGVTLLPHTKMVYTVHRTKLNLCIKMTATIFKWQKYEKPRHKHKKSADMSTNRTRIHQYSGSNKRTHTSVKILCNLVCFFLCPFSYLQMVVA